MRLGAARFVAGETLDDCVVVLRRLDRPGSSREHDPARRERPRRRRGRGGRDRVRADPRSALADEQLPVNVALKLTHLGLELDEELAYANVARVVDDGAAARNLRPDRHGAVERSRRDAADLPAAPREWARGRRHGAPVVPVPHPSAISPTLLPLEPNLRFVKGAYLEPPELAYPAKADVDAAYVRLVETALRGGAYTAVATQDETIIDHVIAFAEREGFGRDRFEFQMLYGVRPALQLDLVARGFKVLVATPYGPEWYPYLMRRLAERPANLGFFARTSCGAERL